LRNQAWALSGGFGIDKLRLEERPRREPGHGEARVRIEWISLNRRDLLLVEGAYNPRQKLPIVPCSDGAGVIDATGAGCERVEVGDSVAITFFPGWSAGAPDMAKLATALGGGPGGDGVLQQSIVIFEQALVRLPTGISTESARPCPAPP
jgi:NADPH:quinone reductase-like Zn-dependent oxidoreductase